MPSLFDAWGFGGYAAMAAVAGLGLLGAIALAARLRAAPPEGFIPR